MENKGIVGMTKEMLYRLVDSIKLNGDNLMLLETIIDGASTARTTDIGQIRMNFPTSKFRNESLDIILFLDIIFRKSQVSYFRFYCIIQSKNFETL